MTRHRRNQITRELWRLRASLGAPGPLSAPQGGGSRPSATTHNNNNQGSSAQQPSQDMKLKSTLNSIFKRLNIDELELLLESVKSKGRAHDHCIHLIKHPHYHSQKHTTTESTTPSTQGLVTESKAICQAWRWPELTDNVILKQLPNCHVETTPNMCSNCHTDQEEKKPTAERKEICINPYHWSKVFYLKGKSNSRNSIYVTGFIVDQGFNFMTSGKEQHLCWLLS